MEKKDLKGLTFTVGSSKGGGSKVPVLDEDLMHEAVLVDVTPEEFTYQNELKKVLKWTFELTDPENEYEAELENGETETRRRKVIGSTSRICTDKSKMYKWYTKIIGRKLEEGETVDLSEAMGVPCNLMITNKQGKKAREDGTYPVYANVKDVYTIKGAKKQAVKVAKVEPEEATEEVETEVEEKVEKVKASAKKAATKATPKKEVKKAEPVEESAEDEAFGDIF